MVSSYEIVFFVLGLILSAFFSGAEAALLSISHDRTRQLIEAGGSRAKALVFAAKKPSELLTTILIGNNIVNIYVASLTTTISQRLFASDAIAISVGFTTLLILIFGEIIPKTFARSKAEVIVVPVIRVLQIFYVILYIPMRIFMFVINTVLGESAGIQGRVVTSDDLQFMVDKAEREKTIDSSHLDLLSSVLEFPTIKVKDIMVPRNQVDSLDLESNYFEVIDIIREKGHSRYPIYDTVFDKIVGFVHVKDLAIVTANEREHFDLKKYMNDPFFIFEHMKIQAVFDYMNRMKVHMAFVKDETGMVVGILTLEDIMEEIFGEIQDEYDDEEDGVPKATQIEKGEGIVVPGLITLRDLYHEYDVEIPQNDSYSTLTGFLLEMLGNNFPTQGSLLSWENYSFELLKVEESEIKDVIIRFIDGGMMTESDIEYTDSMIDAID